MKRFQSIAITVTSNPGLVIPNSPQKPVRSILSIFYEVENYDPTLAAKLQQHLTKEMANKPVQGNPGALCEEIASHVREVILRGEINIAFGSCSLRLEDGETIASDLVHGG